MGLGSSCLEKVVIPYTNSPSTNPVTKVMLFLEYAKWCCSIGHFRKWVDPIPGMCKKTYVGEKWTDPVSASD